MFDSEESIVRKALLGLYGLLKVLESPWKGA